MIDSERFEFAIGSYSQHLPFGTVKKDSITTTTLYALIEKHIVWGLTFVDEENTRGVTSSSIKSSSRLQAGFTPRGLMHLGLTL